MRKIKGILGCGLSNPHLRIYFENGDIEDCYFNKGELNMANKVSDILKKADENFTVNIYSNGFMFEMSGRNEEDDWATAKIVCNTIEDVITLVKEAVTLPRS